MKRTLWLAAAAMIATATGAGAAGGIGGMVTYWNPSDFQDEFGFGGKIVAGAQNFALELRGSYIDSLQQDPGVGALDLQVIPIEAGLVLRLGPETITPYVGAGVGYYLLNGNEADDVRYQVDDQVGWYAAAGVEFALGQNAAIFGEALYRDVDGTVHEDSLESIDSEVDIDLSGLTVNAGIMLRF